MLRIMIVDDEPVIRFGIKASVDWNQEGYQVTGDFANGAEALEMMKSEPCDILITDIKMPVMDGLELTRRALELNPQLKVILVSSYNDFDYVREGLKLGVVDYILKPTLQPEELLQVVKKCEEEIRKELQVEHALMGIKASEMERKRKRCEQGLKRFLTGDSQDLPEGSYPEWLHEAYTAVHVLLHRMPAMEEMYGYLHLSIARDALVERFYGLVPKGVIFSVSEKELFFLIPRSGHVEIELAGLQGEMEKAAGIDVSFGYAYGEGIRTVKESFQRSAAACQMMFFRGKGIYADRTAAAGEAECDLPNLLPPITELHDEQLQTIVDRWRERWKYGGKSPRVLKEEACRVLSVMFKQTADPYALVESFDLLFQSESLDELCARLMEQVDELRKHGWEKAEEIDSKSPVAQAIEYIRSHYTETITLQQVADHVHVSKNYFSILFKQTTGQNFIDYLINLRIERAKELLMTTELKVYEVAEQSGFNDTKYFSKLFKKVTGVSPVDYREAASKPAARGE
jgi:two-component system response regulator YesN